jgi:hypothetical protein
VRAADIGADDSRRERDTGDASLIESITWNNAAETPVSDSRRWWKTLSPQRETPAGAGVSDCCIAVHALRRHCAVPDIRR